MDQTPRQIAREKAIISIYQYLLLNMNKDEIQAFLNEDTLLVEKKKYMDFALSLVDKVLENQAQYMKEITKYIKKGWTFERLSYLERAVLLVATCELLDFDMDKRVVINEAVIFCKKYCDEDSYRFINGILSKVI